MVINLMSHQSKANIKAAVKAYFVEDSEGLKVELVGKSGKTAFVEGKNGVCVYRSIADAKVAISRKNSALTIEMRPEI